MEMDNEAFLAQWVLWLLCTFSSRLWSLVFRQSFRSLIFRYLPVPLPVSPHFPPSLSNSPSTYLPQASGEPYVHMYIHTYMGLLSYGLIRYGSVTSTYLPTLPTHPGKLFTKPPLPTSLPTLASQSSLFPCFVCLECICGARGCYEGLFEEGRGKGNRKVGEQREYGFLGVFSFSCFLFVEKCKYVGEESGEGRWLKGTAMRARN